MTFQDRVQKVSKELSGESWSDFGIFRGLHESEGDSEEMFRRLGRSEGINDFREIIKHVLFGNMPITDVIKEVQALQNAYKAVYSYHTDDDTKWHCEGKEVGLLYALEQFKEVL